MEKFEAVYKMALAFCWILFIRKGHNFFHSFLQCFSPVSDEELNAGAQIRRGDVRHGEKDSDSVQTILDPFPALLTW